MAEYNGWSNYETWNFKLWMDNDGGCCDYTEYDDAYKLSIHLKDEAEEMFYGIFEEAGINGWMHDICSVALTSIDFYEIAEAIIKDNENEKEEEE